MRACAHTQPIHPTFSVNVRNIEGLQSQPDQCIRRQSQATQCQNISPAAHVAVKGE
jgi:hypothetical protein